MNFSPHCTLWRTVGLNEKETNSGCVFFLAVKSPFFAKPLLHFWDTLQGNRAILGYLVCLKSRGMIKVVSGWGGRLYQLRDLNSDPGRREDKPTMTFNFWFCISQLTHIPLPQRHSSSPLQKAQLGFKKQRSNTVPDSAGSGQRSDAPLCSESYCQFPRSASLLMSGKKIQIHNPLPTNLKSKQVWTLKVFSSLICTKTRPGHCKCDKVFIHPA